MTARHRFVSSAPGAVSTALLVLAIAFAAGGAKAQPSGAKPASGSGIYTCTDDRGRRITSDRPIVDCNSKEQRVLNSDGSLRAVRPPQLTADELAEKEARERASVEARSAQADAVRRDRNLLHRYKTEASHNRAREAAVDNVRAAINVTRARQAELAMERKPLLDEAEFYKGRPMPAKLKAALDANDAAVEAQRAAANTQQSELDRINRLYDAELARLKLLWAGAAPGSLGALSTASAKP
jgi:hypothetical protein